MVATPIFDSTGQTLANPSQVNGPLSPLSPMLTPSGGSTPSTGGGPFAAAFASAASANNSGNNLRMEYYNRKLQQIAGQFHILGDLAWTQGDYRSSMDRFSSTPSLDQMSPQSMLYAGSSPIVLDTNGMMSSARSVPNLAAAAQTPSIRVSPPHLNISMNRRFSQPPIRNPRGNGDLASSASSFSPTF